VGSFTCTKKIELFLAQKEYKTKYLVPGYDSDHSDEMTIRQSKSVVPSPAQDDLSTPVDRSYPSAHAFQNLFMQSQASSHPQSLTQHHQPPVQPLINPFRMGQLYTGSDFMSSTQQLLFPSENIYETAAKILFMCVKWAKSVPSFVQLTVEDQVKRNKAKLHNIYSHLIFDTHNILDSFIGGILVKPFHS